ncbi:hypothetical protein GCM10008982_21820 [Anoxybacillus voinovskiensis]|nr:hypothetical protein GCM10008982_21820 [Anoxybacillus voinovskiensis]
MSSSPKLACAPPKNGGVPTQVGGEEEREKGYNGGESPAVICQGEKSSKLEIRLSDDPKKDNT